MHCNGFFILTSALWDGSVPLSCRGAKQSAVALEHVAKVAHEGDEVAESVGVLSAQKTAVFGAGEQREHFGHARLVVSVAVAVAEAALGLGDDKVGGAVLAKELKADVAHAVEAAGTGRK
jgi:hypothetical protein